ncbi:hypothetical protein C8F04DRAFT_1194124 [Mycena alexandri]|uniref:Uncharacterized protein n=1 Tax=Mycena alexandri TaxID=1745969 RepID=A0AAD6SAS4_9AGAR|nr:hypothetical protein C8F04DRAFT_1194124 [Mycena alexandri]
MSTPAVPTAKGKKRSLKPLAPQSTATLPDGVRRPHPPPRVPTPLTMCPPSLSWDTAWAALFANLQQDLEREEEERVLAGHIMDSSNIDGAEPDALERNIIYVEGLDEQQAARTAFEALLQEAPMSVQQYQANWDLAPWPASVDLYRETQGYDRHSVLIVAAPTVLTLTTIFRVRKMNGSERETTTWDVGDTRLPTAMSSPVHYHSTTTPAQRELY